MQQLQSDVVFRLSCSLILICNALGAYSSSAVAQLREDSLSAYSFLKFMCTVTGYAGGESTSQIVRSRPLPCVYVNHGKVFGRYKMKLTAKTF